MTGKSIITAEVKTTLVDLDTNDREAQKQIKALMKKVAKSNMNPATIYEKTREILLRGKDSTEDDTKYLIENFSYIDDYNEIHSLLCLTETNEKKWFAMTDFANSLIEEYKCETPSEKTLCEMIACNYFEKLRLTNYLSSTINAGQYLSHERNGYITALSKSINRADRGYINALNTLREIKSPSLNIHIKTKTAIIGTNQQFNTNLPPDEIIAG